MTNRDSLHRALRESLIASQRGDHDTARLIERARMAVPPQLRRGRRVLLLRLTRLPRWLEGHAAEPIRVGEEQDGPAA